MKYFVIRFVLFSALWGFILYEKTSQQSFSLLMLSASLICFFFLSNRKASIHLYIIITIIITLHGIFITEMLYTSFLLLLIMTMASYRLLRRPFYMLLLLNNLFVLALTIYSVFQQLIFVLLFVITCNYFLVQLYERNVTQQEQHAIHKRILAEYRQLKRMHISTEEIAKAEERTRIAREIHDSVGHRLTALLMKIEMLYIEKPNELLLELKEMTNDSLHETREAVKALQVSETTGINAIVQLIRKLEAESQLLIEFTLKEGVLSIPLSNAQALVLYRVIQEALTNVMRHSTSKQVHIEIGKAAIDALSF